ncbi:MAG: PHP domain-containing protein [Anaerovoracaceae bacterium]
MSYKLDLHLHSYYSDGTLSPTDLVKWAKDKGLDIISLTDHDGIDGVKEAEIAGKALDISVVPGIEFSTATKDGIELHLLGYHIDVDNQELLDLCEELRTNRVARNERYMEILQRDYGISIDELLTRKGQTFIGKPTIARALQRKGFISNIKEAFLEGGFFQRPDVKEIKKEKIDIERGIKAVKAAGGIPVLAHPGLIKGIGRRETKEFYAAVDKLLLDLKKMGLKGLECVYSKHSDEERIEFIGYAEKYHLHITEGSDYHGPEGEN